MSAAEIELWGRIARALERMADVAESTNKKLEALLELAKKAVDHYTRKP